MAVSRMYVRLKSTQDMFTVDMLTKCTLTISSRLSKRNEIPYDHGMKVAGTMLEEARSSIQEDRLRLSLFIRITGFKGGEAKCYKN
jgi:hypothetical protein